MNNDAFEALAQATRGIAAARQRLQDAECAEQRARDAFLASTDSGEADSIEGLTGAQRNVANARLLVEKREIALAEARARCDEVEKAQRTARVHELRARRAGFLVELRQAFERVLTARRNFAAVIAEVVVVVEREQQRASELQSLGEVEHATPLDVVRLAIGQLIDREAPAERAPVEQLSTNVLSLGAGVTAVPTEDFEDALRRLRNEFVATAGPTLADFCAPQPFRRAGASSLATELNARDAAALLREIEEQP